MKNEKSYKYNSDILDSLLNEVTPEESFEIETKMVLAARIGDLIKARGWTKGEFASKANVNASEVSKWLSGTHSFTTTILCKIAFTLGTSLADLHTLPKPEVITTGSKYYASNNKDTQLPYAFSWDPHKYGISPLALDSNVIIGVNSMPVNDMQHLLNVAYCQDESEYMVLNCARGFRKATDPHGKFFGAHNKKAQTV